jgi:hypothetical protein
VSSHVQGFQHPLTCGIWAGTQSEEGTVEELTEAEMEDLEVNRILDHIQKDEL